MMRKGCKYTFMGLFAFFVGIFISNGQHTNILTANLNGETKELSIQQEFTYKNTSNKSLTILYFNDWAHAYSNKKTALAKRFAQDFKKSLHLAKDADRGSTNLVSAVDDDYRGLEWKRMSGDDIVKIELNKPLPPNGSAKIFLTYTVKLPPNRYTSYGYNNRRGYYLKDWYLTPAVFDGRSWHLYSNKNLEDLYTDMAQTTINFTYPKNLFLTTNYKVLNNSDLPKGQQAQIKGVQQKNCVLIIEPTREFTTHITPHLTVVTDIESSNYDDISQGVSINKVTKFIAEHLGEYPHPQLLVSNIDYTKDPLYGINQLPSYIRPYETQFQFEMKFLKTAIINIIEETVYLNPRKEQWLKDAIANYLMIAYVDTYYPNQKLLGSLSKIWGIRGFNLAKMSFNEKYPFLYNLTARKNLDQPLTTSNDSLIFFNQKTANKYKAGIGLSYLASYIGKEKVDESVKTFYEHYKLQKVKVLDFESILKRSTNIDINWFFDTYVSTDKKIDFKIKKIQKTADSLTITLKNKEGSNVPISLFGLKKDSVVSKYWFTDIADEKTFTIPRGNEERLVLNYDQKIPEFNQRDNWKSLGGFLSGNKKLRFQFFKDAENPYYNQIFYVPAINFNANDGFTPGLRISNKTLLERPFLIGINPSYSIKENTLVGSGGLSYRRYHGKSGFYLSNYAISGSSSFFAINSRFYSLTPSATFVWRPSDLLSNARKSLRLRWVNIFRNFDENIRDTNLDLERNPDYSVFNARYRNSNAGIIDFSSWFIDAQHSAEFSKIAFNWEYRKLFQNNRQLNLRFFAGKFLRNKTDSDFFSFALDRPTDYLFDFNYLARSEDPGVYGQQIIIAEGGFKSQLENPFANDWLVTTNVSGNIWRWVELYGDVGLLKNRGENTRFVYDSGVRLNLVTDFFELYFPLYSNNGWEVGQPNYAERIRFVVTVSPRTLIRLATRKWF